MRVRAVPSSWTVAGLVVLLGAAAAARLAREPPAEPTDAELLATFTGNPTGSLQISGTRSPSLARLHARASLLSGDRRALVAIFTITASGEGSGGSYPIQDLRALGALVCEPGWRRWRCGAPQRAVAHAWQRSAALTAPEPLPLGERRTGLRLVLAFADASGVSSELTLIGWLSADGLTMPLQLQTAWNLPTGGPDGPGGPVSWRTDLELRARPGEPDPVAEATTRVVDAATGAEGTWRRSYALRPGVSKIYSPLADPVLVAGSAPRAGWRHRRGLGDEDGEDVSTTLLCDDGRATQTEERREDGAAPVVTASRIGRWEQQGLRASIIWEGEDPGDALPNQEAPAAVREELLLIDTRALGVGPPDRWERVERHDGPCAS